MNKNLSIKLHTIEQHIHSYFLRIWEKILAGKGWTLVFLLWVGLLFSLYLSVTVFLRPLDEIKPSTRLHHTITLWIENGFFRHGGLRVSEPLEINPSALVYKSRPPTHMYVLYIVNLLNYWMRGTKFSLSAYVLYNQVILWISAACLGYLGFRVARRLGTSPFLALICGIIGQIIFHTFPYNLNKYFEPYPEQFSCLAVICFLIIEELDFERTLPYGIVFRGLGVAFLVYSDNITAIPGLGAYVLFRILTNNLKFKEIGYLCFSGCIGIGLHMLQLGWVKLWFPQVSFVGATYLWRSGLDGATNRVGLLTPDKLGEVTPFLRNIGLLSIIIILYLFLRGDRNSLKLPVLLIITAVSFYIVPDYLLSQYALIHPYLRDLFLPVVAILAFCYTLVPYLENKTGNTGLITWILVIVGFCLGMYQLRVFAIMYPLSIPEPNWRIYRYF